MEDRTVRKKVDKDAELTPEQVKMLKDLKKRPIVYDDDCPELSDDQLAELKAVVDKRKEDRRKQTITIRLSPQTIKKAKSLGKGYTSILSRVLEMALNDADFLKQCL